MLEDWVYFEDGVQYTKQKLLFAEKWDKKERSRFIKDLDSTSLAYRTHLNGDSLLQLHYLKYKSHKLGDTMVPIFGRNSINKDSLNVFNNGDSILVIDFSYTNCGPCISSIPALNNLHDRYDSLGIGIYWLDPYKQDWPRIEKFTKFYKVKFPIIEIQYDYVYDYDIRGFPRLFVIKNGILIYYHSGYSEKMEKEVSKILDKALGKRIND
jgi:thiol-disulfide isomerase/thioredoxin